MFSFIPLLIIYLYSFYATGKYHILYKLKHFFYAHLLGIMFFVAPTGYIANYLYYNHPIGPEEATKHQSVERAGSVNNLLIQGTRNVVRYLYGTLGKGFFCFLGGHDPEDYQHFVNEEHTDLSLHKNSPGYRLILNNILFPSAQKKKQKT